MLALSVWTLSGKPSYGLKLPEQLITLVALSATLIWVFPQIAVAQSVQTQSTPQLTFEIKPQSSDNETLLAPVGPVFPRDIPGNKLYTLKKYLEKKQSPLSNYVEILLLQPNWKVVLAISHAESNMCKRQLGHNCWGIGGGNHRKYPSFAEAIVDANDVVQRYWDRGHRSTRTMMPYYVGWNNQSWVVATQDVLYELEQLGL